MAQAGSHANLYLKLNKALWTYPGFRENISYPVNLPCAVSQARVAEAAVVTNDNQDVLKERT
jgi:hypothetical protein